MLKLSINNETSPLRTVVLGIAEDFGGIPVYEIAYDPKSKEHIRKGTFPKEEDLIKELEGFEQVLKKYGVKVLRPKRLPAYNQIYSRDIGFVIDDLFIRSHMLAPREHEIEGIENIMDQMDPDKVLETTMQARVEGGDVMPWDGMLFIGYSKKHDFDKYIVSRTNEDGVEYLADLFPHRTVKSFELVKSDIDPLENALHLDCCFQPIGKDQAIIYRGGFKSPEDYHFLKEYFGESNVIDITQEEMYNMNSNIFSINPTTIVSEKKFIRLNTELRERGFVVEEIAFSEAAKMEGLLRCSTLPLHRE